MKKEQKPEPSEEAKRIAREEIEAARQRWQALSPEEKTEHLRRVHEEAERKATENDRVTQEKLDQILQGFEKLAEGVVPMSAKQEAELFTRTHVIPQMKALGWDSRHLRKIAPQWNCKEQEGVFKLVRALCKGNGAIVALCGARGTGKTTITAQHSLERCEANLRWWDADPTERLDEEPPEPARYEKLGRLAGMFKPLFADFGSINSDRLTGMLEAWVNYPLVVLDEIHESDDLKTQMRFLVDFLDRRYAMGKDTIIISNHEPEDFSQSVNASIISRISETGRIIPCLWPSWRGRK